MNGTLAVGILVAFVLFSELLTVSASNKTLIANDISRRRFLVK